MGNIELGALIWQLERSIRWYLMEKSLISFTWFPINNSLPWFIYRVFHLKLSCPIFIDFWLLWCYVYLNVNIFDAVFLKFGLKSSLFFVLAASSNWLQDAVNDFGHRWVGHLLSCLQWQACGNTWAKMLWQNFNIWEI